MQGKLTNSSTISDSVEIQEKFELIDGDRGPNYPKSYDYLERGYCIFLSTKNVRPNGFRFTKTQFISKEKHEILRKGLLQRGDIVITTRGTLGNVAVYDESVPFEVVRINSGMLILRPKTNDITVGFLMMFIQSPSFTSQLDERRTGSAQPQIPARTLKTFTFPLYKVEEQKRIVAKVDQLMQLCDALEEKLTQSQQDAERLLQAVLREAFNGRK